MGVVGHLTFDSFYPQPFLWSLGALSSPDRVAVPVALACASLVFGQRQLAGQMCSLGTSESMRDIQYVYLGVCREREGKRR